MMSAESLAIGYFNINEVNIYTVPRHRKVNLTSLFIANRNTVTHNWAVNCTINGNRVSLGSGELQIGETAELFDISRIFKPGETISALADISNQISYVLFGEVLPL